MNTLKKVPFRVFRRVVEQRRLSHIERREESPSDGELSWLMDLSSDDYSYGDSINYTVEVSH